MEGQWENSVQRYQKDWGQWDAEVSGITQGSWTGKKREVNLIVLPKEGERGLSLPGVCFLTAFIYPIRRIMCKFILCNGSNSYIFQLQVKKKKTSKIFLFTFNINYQLSQGSVFPLCRQHQQIGQSITYLTVEMALYRWSCQNMHCQKWVYTFLFLLLYFSSSLSQ